MKPKTGSKMSILMMMFTGLFSVQFKSIEPRASESDEQGVQFNIRNTSSHRLLEVTPMNKDEKLQAEDALQIDLPQDQSIEGTVFKIENGRIKAIGKERSIKDIILMSQPTCG